MKASKWKTMSVELRKQNSFLMKAYKKIASRLDDVLCFAEKHSRHYPDCYEQRNKPKCLCGLEGHRRRLGEKLKNLISKYDL